MKHMVLLVTHKYSFFKLNSYVSENYKINDKLRRAACSFVREKLQIDIAKALENQGIEVDGEDESAIQKSPILSGNNSDEETEEPVPATNFNAIIICVLAVGGLVTFFIIKKKKSGLSGGKSQKTPVLEEEYEDEDYESEDDE